MGLLDFMGSSFDDPKTAATLTLAQGLLGGLGTQNGRQSGLMGLAMGLQGYNREMSYAKKEEEARKQREMQQQMQAMQLQALQQQQAERAAAAARKTKDDNILAESFRPLAGPNPDGSAGVAPQFDVRGMIGRGLSMDSVPEALKLQSVLNPARKLTAYKPGDQVRDEQGNIAFSVPESPEKEPEALRTLAAIYGKGSPQYIAATQKLGLKLTTHQPGVNVKVDAGQRFENAYSTDQGKQFSELMGNINKQGFNAPAQIRKLERMSQLLEGVDGGKLAPTGLDIASAMNSIGIKIDPKAGNKEAAEALARELAGGLRQPGTGPMTDKDFENFLTQIPSLSKTAEGRRQITTTMKAALNRDIQVAKMAREYERRNGRVDGGFLDEISQFIAENPVVGAPQGWKVER